MTSEEAIHHKVYEKIFIGKVENQKLEKVLRFLSSLDGLKDAELKKKLIAFANHELTANDYKEE